MPATWYSLQLTAHNGAGHRVITAQVTYFLTPSNIFTEKIFTPQVATLDSSGQTLAPRLVEGGVTPRPGAGSGAGSGGRAAGSVAVPVIAAILVTTTAMLAAVYVYRKRRSAASLVQCRYWPILVTKGKYLKSTELYRNTKYNTQ